MENYEMDGYHVLIACHCYCVIHFSVISSMCCNCKKYSNVNLKSKNMTFEKIVMFLLVVISHVYQTGFHYRSQSFYEKDVSHNAISYIILNLLKQRLVGWSVIFVSLKYGILKGQKQPTRVQPQTTIDFTTNFSLWYNPRILEQPLSYTIQR